MKKMKLLSLLMAAVIVVCLMAGCGSEEESIDNGDNETATSVVVDESLVESEGVPPCRAVERTAIDECQIVGMDEVVVADGGAIGETHINEAAVLGCHWERVGDIEERDGTDGA